MVIKLKRGLRANLPASGSPGEAFFAYDTGELFVANSSGTLIEINSYESNYAEKIYNDAKTSSYNADQLVTQTQRDYDLLMTRYRVANLIGGGTISWINNSIKWTSRIIAIGAGYINGAYYQIDFPAVGTTITRIGASNVTVTADGIPLSTWESLYYGLPITGSSTSSNPANFLILPYSIQTKPAYNSVMIGIRSGDNGYLYLFNRQRIALGGSTTY